MKSSNVSLTLMVSTFAFAIACAGLFGSATDLVLHNAKCVTLATGCSGLASAACRENNGVLPASPGFPTGRCGGCSGTSAVQRRGCVFAEGEKCTITGTMACGGVYYVGTCVQNSSGVWRCDQEPIAGINCDTRYLSLCQ